MTLPIALYTTTIGPTGQRVSDGWLSAGTEIQDIDATIGGSDIGGSDITVTITITIGGGLAPEQVRMTPAELATFAGHVAFEDSAAADYLQHQAEQAAEEMGWQA